MEANFDEVKLVVVAEDEFEVVDTLASLEAEFFLFGWEKKTEDSTVAIARRARQSAANALNRFFIC